MTTDERELVMELVVHKRSKADFLRSFRRSIDGSQLCGTLLAEAMQSKDADDVGYALMVGFVFGFTSSHLEPLLELVSAPWHARHEDVVSVLGDLESPKAVDGLVAATRRVPEYLEFDENRALAVKAIWALGRIDGAVVDAALRESAKDPDPILASAASYQEDRRRGK